MSFLSFIPLIGKVIDRIIPDPTAASAAKIKLYELSQAGDLEELEQAGKIITAEANSEHFIVAAWRPITALTFVFIIANNYILYPYMSLFWDDAPMLEIPPDLWQLLKIMIGGYVVSRGLEKTAKHIGGKK